MHVPKEEVAALGDLQYSQRGVRSAMGAASEGLARVQGGYVQEVTSTSKSLVVDGASFRAEWDAAGPAVPGLPPLEAAARLAKFKARFEASASTLQNYTINRRIEHKITLSI